MKASRAARGLSLHAVVWLIGAFVVVPLIYAVLSGFKSTGELTTNPFGLQEHWKMGNYTGILSDGMFWRQIANSAGIAIGTTCCTVAASAMAAFAPARYAFRGRALFYTLFTIGLMFPFTVVVLPLFRLLRNSTCSTTRSE